MIPRTRAENSLRTRTVGARVPVTRPTRARTLFCGAHTRGTSSARARWGRACRQLAPHVHVLFCVERTRGEHPPHVRGGGCACRQLAPHAHVLFFVERTRGEPSPHVRDGGARAGNSPRTRTYSFLRSARAGNLLRTRAYLLKNKSPTCTPIQTN